jgi:cytidylate kinase
LKIYLEASAAERARRRFEELRARRQPAEYADILQAVVERDHYDSSRDISPMRPALDAVILDSDGLTIEQVLQKAVQLVEGLKQA